MGQPIEGSNPSLSATFLLTFRVLVPKYHFHGLDLAGRHLTHPKVQSPVCALMKLLH